MILYLRYPFIHHKSSNMLYSNLDDALSCLNALYEKDHIKHWKHDHIRNELAKKHKQAPRDLVMIMDYLSRMGMVHKNDKSEYIITYEGKDMLEDGGYVKKQDRKTTADFNLKTRNIVLATGSSMTALYALWKLFAHFEKVMTIEFVTFLCVFLLGLLGGVLLHIIRLELIVRLKRKEEAT